MLMRTARKKSLTKNPHLFEHNLFRNHRLRKVNELKNNIIVLYLFNDQHDEIWMRVQKMKTSKYLKLE